MTLQLLHQTMLSLKGIRFRWIFGSNHKKAFGKLIERCPWLSPFWRTEPLLKMALNHRRFRAYFLKVYKKRHTAAQNVNLSKFEKRDKERNKPTRKLSSFPFSLNSFINGFYNTISTVKQCITYLSVLIGGVFRTSSKI